jgi:PAS domain S-box-containing protein
MQEGSGVSSEVTLWRDPVLRIGAFVLVAVLSPYFMPSIHPDTLYDYAELWPGIALLVVSIAAIQFGLRRIEAPLERRFWNFWTLGFALVLAVKISYLLIPFDAWNVWLDLMQDLLHVLSFLVFILAVGIRPDRRQHSGIAGVLRHLENAGISILVLGLLVHLAVIPGTLNRVDYDSWVPSMLLFVALDAYLLGRLAWWRADTRSPEWRRVVGWLTATVALWLVLDIVETLEYAGIAAQGWRGTVMDLPWYVDYVTLVVAARLYHQLAPRIQASNRANQTEGPDRRPPRPAIGGSLVVAALVLPLAHSTLYAMGVLDPATRPVRELAALVCLVTILGMALVYQRLVERENRRLDDLRARAEERRDLLVAAVEHAGEGIIITDPSGAIEYANPAFEQVTGYARDEVLGENPRMFKSGMHTQEFYTGLWQTIGSGATWAGMLSNRRRDGSIREQASTIAPVKNKSGDIVHYVCVQRDVTRQNQIESRLGQAQKMEALGTLAGGIAHDFNNVLQAITGYSELVRDDLPEGSSQRDQVDLVLKAAMRAKGLIKRIMSFSRPSELAREATDVAAVVEEGVSLLRASLPATIEIRSAVGSDVGTILADASQLQQVLLNLGNNASQAIGDRAGTVEITAVRTRVDATRAGVLAGLDEGTYVRISVRDTGRGIAPDVLHRIYEPFFTTKEIGAGTGLGLSVVHGIVLAHGGAVDAESTVGEGTTLHTYFPASGSAEASDQEVEAPAQSEGGSGHILVVDDEPLILSLARRQLESLGYSVVVEEDGDSALRAFQSAPDSFDGVITDLTMPGRTGIELAAEIKARRPGLPVILMTGFSDGVAPDRIEGSGVDTVLTKPYSARELEVKLSSLLGKS